MKKILYLIITWTLAFEVGCTDLKGNLGQPGSSPSEPANGSEGEEEPADDDRITTDPICHYWGGGNQRGPMVLSGSVADINIQHESGTLVGAVWVDHRIYISAFPEDILEYNPVDGHAYVTYIVDWFSSDVAEIFPMSSMVGSTDRLVISGIHDPISPTQRSTYQLLLPGKVPKLVFHASDNPYITQVTMDCNYIYGLSYHNGVNEVWRSDIATGTATRLFSFELPEFIAGITVTDDGKGNGELILYNHSADGGLHFYDKQTLQESRETVPVVLGSRMQSLVNDGSTIYAAYQSLADTYVVSVDMTDGEVSILTEGHISSFFPLHLSLNGEGEELLLVWRNSSIGANILSSYR